ncbi:MAG: hypothetical protein OXT70_06170 [Chloroflexota bacterium]|nr:hypothetical protein [Chloroflexota bacterium]
MTIEELSDRDRRRALATGVQNAVAQGWRVESQTDDNAILVRTKPHILRYVLLTVVSLGMYWLGGWLFYRPTLDVRQSINIDEFGNTLVNDL